MTTVYATCDTTTLSSQRLLLFLSTDFTDEHKQDNHSPIPTLREPSANTISNLMLGYANLGTVIFYSLPYSQTRLRHLAHWLNHLVQ